MTDVVVHLEWSHDVRPGEGMFSCDRCRVVVHPLEEWRGTGDAGVAILRLALIAQGWRVDPDADTDLCPDCQALGEAHPMCWREGQRWHEHCRVDSGYKCTVPGCLNQGGTLWGPHFCPEHDVERLDRISASLASLAGE